MGNLIKNELIKIFRKKSTYIILIIFFLFTILTNIIYKVMDKLEVTVDYNLSDEYIEYVKEDIKNLNPQDNRQEYIQAKTEIDMYELYKKYDSDSWQAYIIKRDFYNYIYNVNVYKYGSETDKSELTQNPEQILNNQIEKLNQGDWRKYVKEDIEELEKQVEMLKQSKSELPADSSEITQINDEIKNLELQLELNHLRLDKDISYGNDYLNQAIEVRKKSFVIDYDSDEQDMKYQDRVTRQQEIAQNEKAKYIIENKQDTNNTANARGILLNVFDEFSIFIIIFIVMIAGGMISSEMEKGTIKMLLVKPHTRTKILVSKYIVSILMCVFILVVSVVFEVLVGGIIFGFDSLSIPAVVYNFNTNSIQTMNVFAYVALIGLNKLPMYLLLATVAFTASVLFGNTVVAVVLPVLGNIGSAIVNQLAVTFSVKQLAIYPTLNWDFTQFLFGSLPTYEFTSRGFATIVCLIYWIIMIVISWCVFRKKEIKNI